jgi:sec-independent protein translocase protein TatB
MLDIGWTELLVIAIVLIVVVGPKDLPPMLRAFGKMTKRLRVMAGDFRQQFDEALREAELDDVRQTFSDAQKLNPVNSLKDALNPLRQMGNDIRNDLQNAAKPAEPATIAEPWKPEPEVKLPSEPPTFPAAAPATPATPASAETPASRDAAPDIKKPVRKPRAPKVDSAADSAPVETQAAPKSRTPPRKKSEAAVEPAATAPEAVSAPVRKPAVRKVTAVAEKAAPAKEKPAAKAAAPKKPAAKAKKTGEA